MHSDVSRPILIYYIYYVLKTSTLLLDNLREKDEHDNQQNRMSGTLEKPEPASSLLYQNGRSRTFIES